MAPAPRYRTNAGAVFSLKHHLVWCSKYRRKVLVTTIDGRLKGLISEVSAEHNMTAHALKVMSDHVHLFVEAEPSFSVSEIINRFKGRSSRVPRQEFRSLRSRLPTLWSRSYHAGSTGAASESVVRRYIKSQNRA